MPGKGRSWIKGIAFFFLKVIVFTPLFAFGIWLIGIVYFQGIEFHRPFSSSKETKTVGVFEVLTPKQEAVPRDHFHMVDTYVETPQQYQPVCVICHGVYAHGKDKKVRAMLNMHDGYIACSVCHVRQDGGRQKSTPADKRMQFLWVDQENGEIKRAVEGEYGKYPALIFPIAPSGQVFTPIPADAAQEFLKRLPELTKEQAQQAREKLHEPLSKDPVSCADCHKQDGYLDFRALGFPQQRIDHLISTEFVGMIENYETFHLPSVIDFGGN